MKVFISHNSADKKFVRTLKTDLNENGIDTFFDEDSLEFGDSLMERLEEGIKESSHFIIILTPNSIKSNWVKNELKEALKLFDEKTIKKIIPIKYRECIIPESLDKLLYADLSSEVVQVEKDRINFLSDGYGKFLPKLIKTLHSAEKTLTKTDKTKIITETISTEMVVENKSNRDFITKHKVLGYKDKMVLYKYQKKILENNKTIKNDTIIHPVLLPNIYKAVFHEIKYGTEIKFTIDGKSFIIGHFAGYTRTNTIGIAIQAELRRFLKLETSKVYSFSVNPDILIFQRL